MRFGTVVIINPFSGKGLTRQRFRRLVNLIKEVLFVSEDSIFLTEKTGNHRASNLASYAQHRGARLIVVVGGDGTLHQVVNGLTLPDPFLRIAVIPCGTSNVVASFLGMPRRFRSCLEIIYQNQTKIIDLGKLEGNGLPKYAVFAVSVGFDAMINELAHRIKRKLQNHCLPTILGYVPPLLRYTLRKIPIYSVTIKKDGEKDIPAKISFLAVANTPRYGGGLIIDKFAQIDDGLFSLLCAGEIRSRDLPWWMFQMWQGKHIKYPRIFSPLFSFSSLEVKSEILMPAQVDGEIVAPQKHFSITVLPRALSVISAIPEYATAKNRLISIRPSFVGGITGIL